MIFGMTVYTFVHVLISLAAIGSGLVVLWGLLKSNAMNGMTPFFLVMTAATNVTGFLFPFHGVTPGIKLGAISSVVLVVAILARYALHMRGAWRWVYAVTAVALLYFNVFVLIAQLFQKVPSLHALAPTGTEPPFAIAQGVVLVLFVIAGVLSALRFRPAA
jgi:hypothetical protein